MVATGPRRATGWASASAAALRAVGLAGTATVPATARRRVLGRALRTGAVTLAGFAVGRWGLGSVTVAVFATFTALAITGIADFGASISGRATAAAAAAALGVGLAALGTWSSGHTLWAQCAVMFAVGAAVSLSGLLGGYAASGASALIRFYVVAAGSPATTGAIPDRAEGVAIGGAIAAQRSASLPTAYGGPSAW
jgi:hypothetical protein